MSQYSPPSVQERFHRIGQNEEKILKALKSINNINYHYWSQPAHVRKMSHLMNVNNFSANAAFYAYKMKHDAA